MPCSTTSSASTRWRSRTRSTASQRPKIESYNHVGDACQQGYFYMVFHGPDLETFREKLQTKELDMFVSERYLVTIHDEPMDCIDDRR